jgi:hypothetical protein
MLTYISNCFYNSIFRLASLKDNTNLSYKKKTEGIVGVMSTVKAIMKIKDCQIERTERTQVEQKHCLQKT